MKSNPMNRFAVQSLRGAVIAGAMLMTTSACVYAQTPAAPAAHPLTRAEVRHELQELEDAGYNPSQGDDGDYPADIQAAEQKVAARHQAEKNAAMSAAGPAPTSSQ